MEHVDRKRKRLVDDLPTDVYVTRRQQLQILAGVKRDDVLKIAALNPRFGSMVMEGRSLDAIRETLRSTTISAESKRKLVGWDVRALGLASINETYGRRVLQSVLKAHLYNAHFIFAKITGNQYHCFINPESNIGYHDFPKQPVDIPLTNRQKNTAVYHLVPNEAYSFKDKYDCIRVSLTQ